MTMYKVVRRVDGKDRLASAIVTGRAEVEYRPYEWVLPQAGMGPLMVVSTLRAAQAFLQQQDKGNLEIWKCEIQTTSITRIWFDERDGVAECSLEEILAAYPFALLADAVMLTEQVEE